MIIQVVFLPGFDLLILGLQRFVIYSFRGSLLPGSGDCASEHPAHQEL